MSVDKWSTFAVAVFTAVLAGTSILQWDVIRGQLAEAAREGRAAVSPEATVEDLAVFSDIDVRLSLTNIGHTIASNVRGNVVMSAVEPASSEDSLTAQVASALSRLPAAAEPCGNGGMKGFGFLFPGGASAENDFIGYDEGSTFGPSITYVPKVGPIEAMNGFTGENIASGKAVLFATGCIRYTYGQRDGWTRFCFFLDPSSTKAIAFVPKNLLPAGLAPQKPPGHFLAGARMERCPRGWATDTS